MKLGLAFPTCWKMKFQVCNLTPLHWPWSLRENVCLLAHNSQPMIGLCWPQWVGCLMMSYAKGSLRDLLLKCCTDEHNRGIVIVRTDLLSPTLLVHSFSSLNPAQINGNPRTRLNKSNCQRRRLLLPGFEDCFIINRSRTKNNWPVLDLNNLPQEYVPLPYQLSYLALCWVFLMLSISLFGGASQKPFIFLFFLF